MHKRVKSIKSILIMLVVALMVVAGVGYVVWHSVTVRMSAGVVAAWALLATLLLIPMAGLGYWVGTLQARGVIQGLDLGVKPVTQAATRLADIRASALRAAKDEPMIVELPMPQIAPRLPGGGGEVVEL